jgi:hypothetical protein
MKIALIGNCQISTLRNILLASDHTLDIPSLPAVHQINETSLPAVEQLLLEADWVVAQLVSDDYPLASLRTNVLRERFGRKLIVWPNLHFYGYGPDVDVLRDPEFQHFRGPLLDYHSDKILLGYALGFSVEKTASLFLEITPLDLMYRDSYTLSLEELKRREKGCDIEISDKIEEHFAAKRLFYVMNHPSSFLVQFVAQRMLEKMGRATINVPDHYLRAFDLDAAIHPINLLVSRERGVTFQEEILFKGRRMVKTDDLMKQAPSDIVAFYTPHDMVEAFYSFYGEHADRIKAHPRTKRVLDKACAVCADGLEAQ